MSDEIYNNISTAQIDAKLYRDVLAHEDKMEKIYIIIFFILVFLFRGYISYWIKFGVAIPSAIDMKPITVAEEPVQINYSPQQQAEKTFVYKSLINKNKVKIIPQAKYKLAGLTVAYNRDFLFISDTFDSAALYDLGSSWGLLGKKDFYRKYFKSYSAKNEMTGTRALHTEFKTYFQPVTIEYAVTHFAHSHIVPANRNVMAALLKIKQWENVEIEGELIDMIYSNGQHYKTSMSRTDNINPAGDRGNGSCETVFVKKVKIGKFVYK